jgi:ABC-type molybdate transport system substrate-binding protein
VTFTADADCVLPVSLEATPAPDNFAVTAPDVTGCEPAASLNATINQPGTIVWTDLAGNPVANPAAVPAGTYIAIATDLAGLCTDTDTTTVTLQDSVDISSQISVQEICNSTTISFANTSGFTGTWTFGDGTGSSTANSGNYTYAGFGNFTVTFTADADCVLPVSLEATPAPDNFAVTAPDVIGCEPSASLNATINQPGTIVWTDLAGNPVANPAAVPAGTYIAIATDLAGLCTDTDTTTVTLQDSVDISSQISVQEICNSTTIAFANTSGFTGIWTFGDGTGSSTANSGNYTYAGFGNFTVTFTADADCVLPVSLEATPAPDNFAVTAPDVIGCEPAASLNATINQPGTIVWTDLAGNPVANPAAVPAGTYIAIATDLAGLCTDTDTATVTLQDSVDISSQISVQEICNSTTIAFANTSGFTGTWIFGDGTGSSTANSGNYTYAGFGNFTVTFTADADCVLPVSLEATPAPDNFAVTAPDVTGCEPSASLNATINQPGTIVWTDLAGNPVSQSSRRACRNLHRHRHRPCRFVHRYRHDDRDAAGFRGYFQPDFRAGNLQQHHHFLCQYQRIYRYLDLRRRNRQQYRQQRKLHLRRVRKFHRDVHRRRRLCVAGQSGSYSSAR